MYISIDTETTGLNPNTCQVLQLAAVAWTNKDVNKCPTFNMFIDPTNNGTVHGNYGKGVQGEAYALNMNSWILQKLVQGHGRSVYYVSVAFASWLSKLIENDFGLPYNYFTAMGINFGSFDLQFLKGMSDFPIKAFTHRSLEVGSLYATKDCIPTSVEIFKGIAERHNIEGKPHEALYDAKCTLAAAMEKLA